MFITRRPVRTCAAVFASAAVVMAAAASPAAAATVDFSVAVTDSADPIGVGDTVTYDVDVANAGPGLSKSWDLFVSFTGPIDSITATDGACEFNGNLARCFADGDPGSSRIYSFQVTSNATGEIEATAQMVSPSDTDTDPSNNTATETTTVADQEADLAVSLDATAGPLLASQISYDLTVANQGPGSAASGSVVVALPALSASVSNLPSGCTYAAATDQVTCATGAIANGGAKVLSFQANLGLLSLGALPATATRTASSPNDPNAANDTSIAVCTVLTSLLIAC